MFILFSQTSISAGKILRMGKGFTIEGVEGYDLSALFQEGFKRKVS
jgi:hexokinase